jgi:hypothetical protein
MTPREETMIPNVDRTNRRLTQLLLSGTALAVVLAGCGSNGSSTTPDAAVKLDSPTTIPQDVRPSSDLPTPQTDLPTGAGGSMSPDVGADSSGAGGSGGTKDAADASGGAIGSVDGGTDKPATDVPLADAADATIVQDGQSVDIATSEAGSTGACPRVTLAQKFTDSVKYFNGATWSKDGKVVVATENWSLGASVASTFLTTPILNAGSSDVLVGNLGLPAGTNSYSAAAWVFSAGDENDQYAYQLAASQDNHIGLMGRFLGTMAVGSTSVTNPSVSEQSYVAGLDGADGTGAWAKLVSLGGEQLYALAGNPNQDFFVACGAAKNAAPGLAAGLTAGGGKDVVVAAFKASDGTVLWAKLFGGALDQVCSSAALDDAGNVVLSGSFVGTLDFGLGALPVVPQSSGADGGAAAASRSLWVAKLSATGTTLAATSFGTTAGIDVPLSVSLGSTIAVDAQGNTVLAGKFRGAAMTFGNTTLTPKGVDTFVAKLDSNLVPVWARRWGNGTTVGVDPNGLAVNSLGDVVTVGAFTGTVDFGPGNTTRTSQTVSNGADIFIVQLNGSNGDTTCSLTFGQPGTLSTSTIGQTAQAVSINRWGTGAAKDQIAIVGGFYGVLDFGAPSSAMAAGSSVGSEAAFLLQMQP